MIVIDTSVLIAILQEESDHIRFKDIIANADVCRMSALTLFETSQVMFARRKHAGLVEMRKLLDSMEVEFVPFDETQAEAALDAFMRYGKGIHPAARLNLGDCASYALAKTLGAPLLYKGADFAATDIVSAV